MFCVQSSSDFKVDMLGVTLVDQDYELSALLIQTTIKWQSIPSSHPRPPGVDRPDQWQKSNIIELLIRQLFFSKIVLRCTTRYCSMCTIALIKMNC